MYDEPVYVCPTCEDKGYVPGKTVHKFGSTYATVKPCIECKRGEAVFRGQQTTLEHRSQFKTRIDVNQRNPYAPTPTGSAWRTAKDVGTKPPTRQHEQDRAATVAQVRDAIRDEYPGEEVE